MSRLAPVFLIGGETPSFTAWPIMVSDFQRIFLTKQSDALSTLDTKHFAG